MDEQKDKCCENCKFYRTHYIIFRTKLTEFGGHCTNDLICRPSSKYKFQPLTDCDLWESNETQIAENKKRIVSELYDMKARLDDIIMILNKYDET